MKIVVLTSNKYVHMLTGFVHLFNKFYPNQEVTVVRYDVRPPKLPDNFKQFAIGNQSDYSWSSGLKHYLEQIEDEFVLLMLEDYYLDRLVNVGLINSIYNFMSANSHVFKFDLTDDRTKVPHKEHNWKMIANDKDVYDVIQSDINAPFLASVQVAIWRRDFLLGILNKTDNPWQFEKNKRTKTYLKKHDGIILGCVNPPMSYVNVVGGEGNKPGEYDLKKFPQWMKDELKENKVWLEK